MPTAVLMMIGQTEVMKITKIADGWLSRNAASESGSHASGGTVRNTWKIGSSPRIAQIDWPMMAPMSMVGLSERAELRGGRLEHRREGSSFVLRGWIPWAA